MDSHSSRWLRIIRWWTLSNVTLLKKWEVLVQRNDQVACYYYSHLDWGREDYQWEEQELALVSQRRLTGQAITSLWTRSWRNYSPTGRWRGNLVWWLDKGSDANLSTGSWRSGMLWFTNCIQCLIANNHHHTPFPGEDVQIFDVTYRWEQIALWSRASVLLESCQTINEHWGCNITDTLYKSPKADSDTCSCCC